MPLKELEAKNAKPKDRAYKLADSEGLFLLVQPNGSKLWRMKYRFGGKEKLLSFGAYPDLGISAAREKRCAAKQLLAQGKDPMANKADMMPEGAATFLSVAQRWHENRESSLDAAHSQRVWSRLERDVFPALGGKMMHEITPPDVLEMIRKIEARGALDISRRAKQGVGQIFQFAIACGLVSSDPTTHLRGALKPRPRVKHMSRLPLTELPQFLLKLKKYEEEGDRRSAITRDAVTFALLTWVRTKELRFAVRSEFEDLDGKVPVWRIPAERMLAAKIFALHRRDIGRRGREQRAEAFEAFHVGGEPVGERQRHGGEQALDLEIALVGKIPACGLVDRLDRAFVAVTKPGRGKGREAIEDPDQTAAFLEFGLDVLPFRRLLGQTRQEARAARSRQAGRAHEFEPGLGGGGFLVGIDKAQHGRGGTRKTQLVGKQVADQACAFPRRPARRHIARAKMPHIEGVGIHRADFGHAVIERAGRAEALGLEVHPVFMDDEFDVAPDRLVGNRVIGVVRHGIVLRRGGRRCEIVDQRDQALRLDFGDAEIERLQHGDEAFAGLDQFLIGDSLGCRHAYRNDHLVVTCVERCVVRGRVPDHAIKAACPVAGDGLINAALEIAGRKPRSDDPADARRCKVQDLEAGSRRQSFGEELPQDFAGALVGANERRDRQDEALRACVHIEPALRVINPVGYSRAISPFWNAHVGVRHDIVPNPSRTYAVLGIEGIAPYWFHLTGQMFFSDKGDLRARLEGSYDERITQRLILQPRAEFNISAQDMPAIGVGSGLTDFELGARLRYEIRREFAPYVGVEWIKKTGETARLARLAGEDPEAVSFVAGVRVWF